MVGEPGVLFGIYCIRRTLSLFLSAGLYQTFSYFVIFIFFISLLLSQPRAAKFIYLFIYLFIF